jgi:hypothetical protein
MANKSYINQSYYLFIRSFYQHDITVTRSNDEKVHNNFDTKGTGTFYWSASRSVSLLKVDPEYFHTSALRLTASYIPVTLQPIFFILFPKYL